MQPEGHRTRLRQGRFRAGPDRQLRHHRQDLQRVRRLRNLHADDASDGPHYGANVKLDKAGAYKLVLKIESPEKKGWMLHVDPETGVKGRFWTEPIEVTFPDWNYTPQEW